MGFRQQADVTSIELKLRGFRLTKAAELAEAGIEGTLTYYAFPEEHWRRIRTTDVIDKPFRAEFWSSCGIWY